MATTDLGLVTDAYALLAFHASSGQVLDANNDGMGMLFTAPKSGNITAIYVHWGGKTGTAPTYRIGIETGTATRVPDGTYLGSGNAYADQANPTASSLQKLTLGAAAVVTAGTTYWATVRYQTGTINGSNFIAAFYYYAFAAAMSNVGGAALTAGTWGGVAGMSAMAVEYDDGTIVGYPVRQSVAHGWGSGNSPKFRGTLYTPPVTVEVEKVLIAIRCASAGADFNLHIMEGTNATPLQTILLDHDVNQTTGNPQVMEVPITPIELASGTEYRFLIEPTTATAISSFSQMAIYDATAAGAIGCGSLKYTSATALGGAYTDVADGFACVMPVVKGVSTGSGSGGLLTHPGMAGGML